MKIKFSRVALAAAMITGLTGANAALASFPDRPIKLIVPFTAGGATDMIARFVGQSMSEKLGQPIVIDYKAGAGTIIGADALTKSEPDGYTMLLGTATTFAINPILHKKLSYDPLTSFTPIGVVGTTPLALVANIDEPSTDVESLIDNIRENPARYSYGSHGSGTPVHFAAEMLWSNAKVKVAHIPYKGAAPALNDLMGGQIPISFETLPAAINAVNGGRVKILAVTSQERSPMVPNIPTIAESGYPGFSMQTWFALVAPKGLDSAIQNKLSQALSESLADPALKEKLVTAGIQPGYESPAGYIARVESDLAKLKPIARDSKIELN